MTSYDGVSLTHTLIDSVDSLSIGSLYKFRFEAVNEINNSQSSQVVEFALVDKPSAPQSPVAIFTQTDREKIAIKWAAIAATQSPG